MRPEALLLVFCLGAAVGLLIDAAIDHVVNQIVKGIRKW